MPYTIDTSVSLNGDTVFQRLQRALGEHAACTRPEPDTMPAAVLVMDDDGIDRRSMARALKALPNVVRVYEAETIASARALLDQGIIDVAFFDFSLPDGEGVDLLPVARTMGTASVIVTGAGNERVAVRAMNAGAADYVVKDVAGEYLRLLPLTFGQVMQRRHFEKERANLLARVEDALSMVRLLGSFVRMCCVCKKIKVTEENWEPVEAYLLRKANAQFSHGYCPECFKEAEKELG